MLWLYLAAKSFTACAHVSALLQAKNLSDVAEQGVPSFRLPDDDRRACKQALPLDLLGLLAGGDHHGDSSRGIVSLQSAAHSALRTQAPDGRTY